MVHVRHSRLHWEFRCVVDSEGENTSSNILASSRAPQTKAISDSQSTEDDLASTGTRTPPWRSPGNTTYVSKERSRLPSSQEENSSLRSPVARQPLASPTTSSPLFLETPPGAVAHFSTRTKTLASRPRQARQLAAAPYAPGDRGFQGRSCHLPEQIDAYGDGGSTTLRPSTSQPQGTFVIARWPCRVAHLRKTFNPLASVLPYVPHFGWCDCSAPCRCGNGLLESDKVLLGCNLQTAELAVVASEDIEAGVVLGQYLGELEHVSVSRNLRPRNSGPVAEFLEVANGRRTTVVVATTQAIRRGEEVTVDYGDTLWFVCRCQREDCRHREIQDHPDP
ncbi:hypothetical protein F441_20117 [Phytophthora nicotianae CJ01A1]|uniref:SET domain-containing protein n=2 Tax=Phytophthora nicotianae TaxID=4792 RepID=W2VYR2_PHYNI|nr:hypothetical protein L916_19558 [Phytophthora nicotianae]ETP02868.1 hypothetical protein F441_20117 [Phytophthora nicotianae CJ01A1]